MNDRFLNFLGLARRAGKLEIGFDPVCDSIKKEKAKLIIFANDISDGTRKKAEYIAMSNSVNYVNVKYTKDEICTAIGKYAALISVTDKGFADRLYSMACDVL